MIRRILEGLADKVKQGYYNKDRVKFLKDGKETIHITESWKSLCGELSVYAYEEFDDDGTFPWVHSWDKEEIKYANCKKCLELKEKE